MFVISIPTKVSTAIEICGMYGRGFNSQIHYNRNYQYSPICLPLNQHEIEFLTQSHIILQLEVFVSVWPFSFEHLA